MKKELHTRNFWHDIFIIFCALVSGFLLSFIGFGLLWSGISWPIQLIMALPFLLLSYAVYRWSKGALGICAFIAVGAAPLGVLISRFRDTNDSHLMPALVVLSWILGVLAGCYLGYLSRSAQMKPTQRITLSE
ncbi:MAG: lysophosphatidic acid receptor [Nitrosomonas sp.]|nr:lysophosphatidic acid receptor [Nitrosomonas sp.]